MTTVEIVSASDISGEKSYRAIAGDKSSVGKTAGQALDALATQLGETEFSALLVIQNFRPDSFFSAQQQERLSELMHLWRIVKDEGNTLPSDQQAELDSLAEDKLRAATARTAAFIQQESA
jgi:hypothetical protein